MIFNDNFPNCYYHCVTFSNIFSRICSKEAELCLNLCFKIILDEEHHSNDIRKGVTNRVILVLLRTLDSTVVKQFYVVNIKTIMQKCEARLAKVRFSCILICIEFLFNFITFMHI